MTSFSIWHWLVILAFPAFLGIVLARTRGVFPGLKRAIFGIAKFEGRATRTEVLSFWLLTTIVSQVALAGLALIFEGRRSEILVALGADFALILALLPLLARRLHDMDWTGHWLWLLTIPFIINLDKKLRHAFLDASNQPAPPILPEAAAWLALPIVIALMIALFAPGTIGANRYGPDPREGS